MKPVCSCVVTKIIIFTTILAMTWLLKDGMKVVDEITTIEPLVLARNAALLEMMIYEKDQGSKRLSNIQEIVAENSDELPDRNNTLNATELCKGTGLCAPKFWSLETRTSPKHKMLNCIVQKSMSTVMTALMCYLFDEKEFIQKGRDIFTEWDRFRFCKDKNEYNSVSSARKFNAITNIKETGWSFTMVTRDPVERFISGFVDRCIRKPRGENPCNGCHYNMTCFVEREYERIMDQVKDKHLKRTFEDVHFFPQNWRCELHKEYKNFEFIHYSSDNPESFIIQVMEISERQNVTKSSLDFMRNQITNSRTVHVTSGSPARKYLEERLRNSPYLMEFMVKMFYFDFRLFGYPFPEGF